MFKCNYQVLALEYDAISYFRGASPSMKFLSILVHGVWLLKFNTGLAFVRGV